MNNSINKQTNVEHLTVHEIEEEMRSSKTRARANLLQIMQQKSELQGSPLWGDTYESNLDLSYSGEFEAICV